MWKVRLQGLDEKGYEFLYDLRKDMFSRKESSHKNNKYIEYFINIEGYDDTEPTKILEIAEKELRVYISVLKLSNHRFNLEVDYPCKVNEDGTIHGYLFFVDHINITDNCQMSVNGIDTKLFDKNFDDIKSILNNALNDATKKELLILIGGEINWINSYKIYEILKKHYMKESDIKKYKELRYFAHSANSPEAIGIENSRHAVQPHENPKKTANLYDSFNKLSELSKDYIKKP